MSSPGFPSLVAAGRISPRAPRRVFSVTSAICVDVPELVRFAELALADRPGVRIGQRHEPVVDRLARDPLLDLRGDLLAAVGELLELGRPP